MKSQIVSTSSTYLNRTIQSGARKIDATRQLVGQTDPVAQLVKSFTQSDPAKLAEPDSAIPSAESPSAELHIPHIIFDNLLPTLSPAESLVYLRLYRLSYGFNRETCTVSIWKLGKAVNLSERTTHRAVYMLEQRGLIKRIRYVFGSKGGGLVFQVNLPPAAVPQAKNLPARLAALPGDLFSECCEAEATSTASDPHREEVIAAYTQATGNCWRPADAACYEKIKHVSAEKIIQAIISAKARSASRPNSFSYFIKEILDQANPSSQSRISRKHALKKIMDRIRSLHVGAHNYTAIDFVEDVKTACAREGVCFDNDLFSELIR